MNKLYIEKYLEIIGFNRVTGKENKWIKSYTMHDGYSISIDLNKENLSECKIDYGNLITIGRKTTCNFSQTENLVVLECVNRLLMKGYSPKHIQLEKNWRVGGYLDVYVVDDNNNSYLMIDCKCWGAAYNTAKQIIITNNYKKEQLFNYYLNEKSTKYVALYTSHMVGKEIKYKCEIIDMREFKDCNNQAEIYEKWDKNFQSKGIFDKESRPFNIEFSPLKLGDLIPLDFYDVNKNSNDDGTIFNNFAEILRRNVISDKNNAYNVIFNLILCKIVDEDLAVDKNKIMEFQWNNGETTEQVIEKLSKLYKRGIEDYLDIHLLEMDEQSLEQNLDVIKVAFPNESKKILEIFKKVKIYKSNEFAFKEIVDDRTFEENGIVLKAVVKLLEGYSFKETNDQSFLGYFFEKLLNIGMKQEAGQFFSPPPIAEFNNKSIPFEKIIKDKIKNKEEKFLPYLIDNSNGAAHFLTSAMDRIGKIFSSINTDDLKSRRQIVNYQSWNDFKWAQEFVYGVEKDFRLVKTAKVACFLNGESYANIFYGDGLDSFDSPNYSGKLSYKNGMDNGQFDVLEGNPPYSVENFILSLEKGEESFELYKYLTDKSDDIECLFIERAKQLVKEGGYVGIILPASILFNLGIHEKTRKLMLKYFKIVGIVEFGTQTFMATGQRTVNLFMIRRSNNENKLAYSLAKNHLVERLQGKKSDIDYNNNTKVFNEYFSTAWQDFDIEEYVEKLRDDKFLENEAEKLMFFLLTYNNKIVIADSKDKEEELRFLGYEHSDRKKYEGIHPYPNNKDKKIISMLFDSERLDNPDKVSTYIYKNFLGEELPEISGNIKNYVSVESLHNLIDFSADEFKARIYVDTLDNIYLNVKKYELLTLGNKNVAEILDYMRKPVKKSDRVNGKYPYYGASGMVGNINDYIFDEELVLIGEDGARWAEYENTSYKISGKSWVNNHAHVIRTNKNKLKDEFLVILINRLDFSYLKRRPNGGKLLQSELKSIKLPIPSIEEQDRILGLMKNKSNKEAFKILDKELGIN